MKTHWQYFGLAVPNSHGFRKGCKIHVTNLLSSAEVKGSSCMVTAASPRQCFCQDADATSSDIYMIALLNMTESVNSQKLNYFSVFFRFFFLSNAFAGDLAECGRFFPKNRIRQALSSRTSILTTFLCQCMEKLFSTSAYFILFF